jgi:hypothetical protein
LNAPADSVLLGTALQVDGAGLVSVVAVFALWLTLALACLPTLRASLAARSALGFVLLGALLQVLAGELLLFLTGGAVAGYAMLALSLAGPRALTVFHALAATLLVLVGDLALLELVMLLAKYAPDLSYGSAGTVLEKTLQDGLALFCLVLGFGSRLALPALCIPEGRSSAANVATLPGWLLLGMCSTLGAVRLFCVGSVGASCAAPGTIVLWWVPVLAAIAWQLPRAVPGLVRLVRATGQNSARLRDTLFTCQVSAIRSATRYATRSIILTEKSLTRWPVALGLFLLLLLTCAVLLLQAVDLGAAVRSMLYGEASGRADTAAVQGVISLAASSASM